MKVTLISVGALREPPLRELATKFSARLPHYMPFEILEVADSPKFLSAAIDTRKAREGEAILEKISPGDFVVLFDERGREMTSREFATFIDRKMATLSRNLVFVIGGPYGFSDAVYQRADMQLCLSKMTFTHEMARVVAIEQIYRAATILRGEPYHHD